MRATLLLAIAAFLLAAAAPAYEPWDTKLRNGGGFTLKEEEIALGATPAFINGNWQGNYRFELSNCPRKACKTYRGEVHNSHPGDTWDFLGVYAFDGQACAIHATIGVDREDIEDGQVFKLVATDAAKTGCRGIPAAIAGHYEPIWINHAKMAAQNSAAH
jgi:hypothetical protein